MVAYFACLRGWFDVDKLPTQEDMAALAGTTTDGTGITGLRKALRKLKLKSKSHTGPARKIKGSLAILWIPATNHWTVIVRKSPLSWLFLDPEHGSQERLKEKHIVKSWLSEPNSYYLEIQKP
jgi:ABC-type bacteriocin/lantibiotic exporter with double-glycine peptidase domain